MQNEDERAQAEALARIHSALLVPSNSKLAVFRQEYEHRLRTFTVQNYFGKPHALSPLICARLGFRNIGSSELECTGCKEKLVVHFPECLSATARNKLTCLYEDQLTQLHLDGCPFRRDAQQYMQQSKEENVPSDLIPALFTQVWRPEEVLELLDPLRPCKVVRERWTKAMEWLEQRAVDLKSWKLPPMNEKAFQHFVKNEDELLERIFQIVQKDAEESSVALTTRPHQLELGALLIVLLGWTPDTTEPSSSSLHCSICLSKLHLGAAPTADEPSPKRMCQRSNAPVDSHRYYCPYVRGLPRRNERFCDRIMLRLLNEATCTTDNEESSPIAATDFRLGIRKLLKDVISPSHSKLTSVTKK